MPALVPAAGEQFLPHGYCFLWNKPLLWTHVASDVLIGLAYVTISVSLAWLVHRARREIPFSAAFVMFGLFIVACGMTHFLEVVTFWDPIYPQLGAVKAFTAVVSVATAVTMPRLAPRVHATVRDARAGRAREVEAAAAAARAGALEEANAELARLNASLADALATAEAERARAERANRAKADFLAAMSHELRTPLNAIGGYAELLALGVRGPVTAGQGADLARIRRANQHLTALVTDVLNFAKLDAGRVEYRVGDAALGPILADVEALVAPQAAAKGLTVDYGGCAAPGGGDGAPPAVRADPEKLRQVLVNLLTNAVKFTDAGGRVAVTCAADVGPAAGGPAVVRLRVADTGRGIPADQLERIFEPFVQVDRHRTAESQQGVGLGLAISRDLARGMGGDLTAESTEGEGSTFTLTLPAA